jgi:uncharacterized membrane protein YdjX (TVP38/TMEM64 family)
MVAGLRDGSARKPPTSPAFQPLDGSGTAERGRWRTRRVTIDADRLSRPVDPPMHRLARLALVAAFFVALAVLVQMTGLRDHLSLAFLRAQFEGHVVQGLLLFALLFSLGSLVQVPGWIFLAAAVLTLGRVWGGAATLVAAIVSACVSFAILRGLGGDALRELPGRLAARAFAQLDAHPVRSVALLRMVMGTAPPLNLALALSGVRFRHYLAGSLIGLPVPIAAYTLFFDAAARLFHWNIG